VGDFIRFRMKYMGALGIMNSAYIDKIVEWKFLPTPTPLMFYLNMI
jgi:hypothetical protein